MSLFSPFPLNPPSPLEKGDLNPSIPILGGDVFRALAGMYARFQRPKCHRTEALP